ncbi:MAG: acyl--CoA ligase [Myxococcales bacterium]|nr:acyl--CoA ligase [Myxococcales bacterium]
MIDPLAIPHPLAAFARARPDHLALRHRGVDRDRGPAPTWSAAELLRATQPLAGRLVAAELGPGDRIAVVGRPSPAWVIALHAIGWIGASLIAVDPGEPAEERARRGAEAAAWLVLEGGEAPTSARWILTLDDATLRPTTTSTSPPERPWPLTEERAILFTSGSTGRARPVALTTAQLLFGALGGAIHLGHHRGDAWHACLAPWHVGGLMIPLRTAWLQTTLDLAARFDPAAIDAGIDAGEITQISLVPAMLRRLLERRGRRRFPATLRWILLGGAAADEADIAAAEALGATVCPSWGMSEAAAQIATRAPDAPRLPGVVGPPLPFARVDADPDEGGRLRVRGPQVAGELRTLDRGMICPDGQVTVSGRLDRVVISGGRNIDPAAVERVIAAHPAVAQVHVRGLDDRRLGQRLVAFVAPRAEPPAGARDLGRFAAARLHPHDRPRLWALVRAIPTGAAGKVSAQVGQLLAARLEAELAEAGEEGRRRGDRPEAGEVDERVHVLDAGVPEIVGPLDREAHPQAPAPVEGDAGDPHEEAIAEARRPAEVGLGVDQRQPPARPGHRVEPAGAERGRQDLLPGVVAELEEAAKEDDASGVDLAEADNVDVGIDHHQDEPASDTLGRRAPDRKARATE